MFLFLLLLLVFPHIDNVLGARMELRELEEINHADPVTVQKGIPIPRWGRVRVPKIKNCPKIFPACRPPPPPKRFS
ncbi:unnamed protein product [Arabidopsis lyrata]|nr:unnamed protein product [Arabidopsis lyrata]